jgi:hypothetical protein
VTPTDNIAYVPTPAMLAGDFSAITSPACNNGRQIALRAPFVNNQVSPALFSPAALNLVKRLPTTTDPCGQTTFSLPSDRDEAQYVSRIDYQMRTNNSVFGRYMRTTDKQPVPLAKSDNILTTTLPGVDNMAQSATLGDTMVFGSSTVNAVRFAFNQTTVNRFNNDFFAPADLGIDAYEYSPTKELILTVSSPGSRSRRPPATRGIADNKSYQWSDDLTVVRGTHQFAFGVNTAYWTSVQKTWARGGGTWDFNGTATGLGMADLLLGRVSLLEQGDAGGVELSQWYTGLYAQDTWRAAPRVTINAGVRWEPFTGQQIDFGAIANFNHDNFLKNVKSTVYKNAPAGFLYPGDPGFPKGESGFNSQYLNFAPRLGVAWDVTGDGRTSVRSSYGLNYDMPVGETWFRLAAGPPFGNRTRLSDVNFDRPYATYPGGNPHPIVIGPSTVYPSFGAFGAIDPNINAPRTQSWNVTIERQFGSDWGASASYLGSYADRLWGLITQNPGVYMGQGPCTIAGVTYPVCTVNGNVNQRRKLFLENPAEGQFVANLDELFASGSNSYRGLKLSFQRRSTAGLSLNGNYTLSRCFGLDWANTGGTSGGYENPDDPDADRGHCDADRTHIANFTAGILTPHVDNAALNALVSNWRLSGILKRAIGKLAHSRDGRQLLQRRGRHRWSPRSAGLRRCLRRQDADELSESRRVRPARARCVRQPRAQQHSRARRLEGRSRRFPSIQVLDLAECGSQARGVQPAEQLQLGQPEPELQLGTVWPDPDDLRRHADHAVRREIRVLRTGGLRPPAASVDSQEHLMNRLRGRVSLLVLIFLLAGSVAAFAQQRLNSTAASPTKAERFFQV